MNLRKAVVLAVQTPASLSFSAGMIVVPLTLLIRRNPSVPAAPTGPPVGVKVTLIEDDTALVSWKPPDGPETVVTRYTILYASRKAWIAGEWQVLHREGECVTEDSK